MSQARGRVECPAPVRLRAREPGQMAENDTQSEMRCSCGRLMARARAGAVWVQCKRCKRQVEIGPVSSGEELRCACRRLLARGIDHGVQLSCPRCKRLTLVNLRQPD
jgi:phage FluMu protein Com